MPKPSAENTSWDKLALAEGNQAVVALFKVEEVSDSKADTARITQVIGNADYESVVQHLKSQADITISQNALDAETGKNQ